MTEAPVRSAYANRIVGHETRRARDIVPNPLNWREHPAVQRAALSGILGEVGWVQSVVVNQRTGRMIDGHLRVEIAAARDEDVPVVLVDLTDEEEAYVLATLDPIAALATTNEEALRDLLGLVASNDDAVNALLAQLRGEQVDPFHDLVGDSDLPAGLSFEIVVTVTTPADRDRVVTAIREQGFAPNVSASRE